MGIAKATLRMLVEEARRRPFHGAIATFGKMSISASPREISEVLSIDVSQPVDDDRLFRLLGFDHVESIDYSGFEGATRIVDLNCAIPSELHERFDVVLDSGTLEHVFHLPNALSNAISMAKVGGRVIISAPSSNYMDHGFYMFSPTLFMDYFVANNLAIETFYIIRHSIDARSPWRVYDYRPGDYRKFFVGCLDRQAYGIFAIVTRTEKTTVDRIPQQSYYRDSWDLRKARPSRRIEFAKSAIKRVPGALAFGMRLQALIKRRGVRGLRYIGKY